MMQGPELADQHRVSREISALWGAEKGALTWDVARPITPCEKGFGFVLGLDLADQYNMFPRRAKIRDFFRIRSRGRFGWRVALNQRKKYFPRTPEFACPKLKWTGQ